MLNYKMKSQCRSGCLNQVISWASGYSLYVSSRLLKYFTRYGVHKI